MLKFLKAGIEFNNLAKSMNGMNAMIQELIPQIKNSYNTDEFTEEILVLAYIARKGVFDRIEEYNWSIDAKIVVPTIDRGRITLMYALSQTVGKLHAIAAELELSEIVTEIIDRGQAYYQVEKNLPYEITKKI